MIRYLSKLDPLRLELIAPEKHQVNPAFENIDSSHQQYRHRISELQRFRGGVYLREGFLRREQLDRAARHYSALDRKRWHLLVVDPANEIKACASLRFYEKVPAIEQLAMHHVLRRATAQRFPAYEGAVQRLMNEARRDGIRFGEVGGWAVSHDVRNGAATLATILAAWSLIRIFGDGDAICVATVGKGRRADRILSRMGGFALSGATGPLPSFFDAGYNSEIDVLGFDSRRPCPVVVDGIDVLCRWLRGCQTYAPQLQGPRSTARGGNRLVSRDRTNVAM